MSRALNSVVKQPRHRVEADELHTQLQETAGHELYVQQTVTTSFHVSLSQEIGPPHQYSELIHLLRTATEQDEFHFHINTRGGMLETGTQLLTAMRSTDARIITYAEGAVYSLGSMLLLAGDEIVVGPYTQVMCHVFNGGVQGSGSDMVTELSATVDWFTLVANDVYFPFLTMSEIDEMMAGRTFWMLAPEIHTRLLRVQEHRRTMDSTTLTAFDMVSPEDE